MHGFISPATADTLRRRAPVQQRLGAALRRYRSFLLVVVVPSLLVAIYYLLIAANQYQSEAHFIVRAADQTPISNSFSQIVGMSGGMSTSHTDALSVADYLTSHDAANKLRREVQLVPRFRRPEADIISRLWYANPTPEALLSYYRRQIKVVHSSDTGITTVTVRTFRPNDSFQIIKALMAIGEARVNDLNVRSYADAVSQSRAQLTSAEDAAAEIQGRLTSFRQTRGDIDPQGSGQAQIGLVSDLTSRLAQTRAQLSAMAGLIDADSPQYVAVQARVRALEAQVSQQSGRLAGGGEAIASDLGGYEELRLRQEFAGKRYEAAAANFEKARADALKQQLYLVPVVDPNMPVKSQYPERLRIILTVFIGLLVVYAIGWLIAAGVKEHAA